MNPSRMNPSRIARARAREGISDAVYPNATDTGDQAKATNKKPKAPEEPKAPKEPKKRCAPGAESEQSTAAMELMSNSHYPQ